MNSLEIEEMFDNKFLIESYSLKNDGVINVMIQNTLDNTLHYISHKVLDGDCTSVVVLFIESIIRDRRNNSINKLIDG